MKLFLQSPIEGSPVGTVAAKVSEYLRHKLHFSERFDEGDPESRFEFYAREAMTYLAIVQCLLAEHPDLQHDAFMAAGEMRLDIEHDDAHAVRALVQEAPKREPAAKVRRSPPIARSRKVRSSRASKRVRRKQLSRQGREAIARAAMKRWKKYRQEKGRTVTGS